jgi:hypothetical protein
MIQKEKEVLIGHINNQVKEEMHPLKADKAYLIGYRDYKRQ